MPTIEPAGEKIVRNLQQAIERLHSDIERVELWASSLGCFAKPIPDYSHGQTRFDLPARATREISRHSDAAARFGSPRQNPARQD